MPRLFLVLALLALGACTPAGYQPATQGLNEVYGPGVTSGPFGEMIHHEPGLQVQPNAYGLGMGMDQYVRPVAHGPVF